MDKVSRYLVVSDGVYEDDGGVRVQMIYATRTAKLSFVVPAVADALRRGDVGAVPPSLVPGFRDAQVLVPDGQDELESVLVRNKTAWRDRSTVAFILLPTSYCNMGCTYCGQEHVRGGLSADHRDRVTARVLRAIRLETTRHVKVDWFGSEPMMGYAVLRSLATKFVAAAADHGATYSSTMVTNGSLLTERNLDVLIRQCGLGQFDITLDGPPEVHDVHRPLKSGKGSFDRIVRTVGAAVRNPDYEHVGFDFRTNVDINNCDTIDRYIDIMAEAGFARPNVTFTLARVRPWGNDVSAIELGREEFAERELGWVRRMQAYGLGVPVLPTVAKKITCPAVRSSGELISGTGNIFSCTDHPLVPDAEQNNALAHIGQDNLPLFRPEGEFDGWDDDIRAGVSGCRHCVFLPTCGGECPKAWHEGNPPCPSYKLNHQGRFDILAERCGLRPVRVAA